VELAQSVIRILPWHCDHVPREPIALPHPISFIKESIYNSEIYLSDADRGGRKRLQLRLRKKELLHYAASLKVTFIIKFDSKRKSIF